MIIRQKNFAKSHQCPLIAIVNARCMMQKYHNYVAILTPKVSYVKLCYTQINPEFDIWFQHLVPPLRISQESE